jgi:small subunit ribosomal protein S6
MRRVNTYELIFIIAPTLEDEALQAQVDSVANRVTTLGGEVSKIDIWGRRRLAYPIKKFHDGLYVLFNMQMPPEAINELERGLKLSEEVIRHLVVRDGE